MICKKNRRLSFITWFFKTRQRGRIQVLSGVYLESSGTGLQRDYWTWLEELAPFENTHFFLVLYFLVFYPPNTSIDNRNLRVARPSVLCHWEHI
jgi:hypothetical protein